MKLKYRNTNRGNIIQQIQNDQGVTDHKCFKILLLLFGFVFLIFFLPLLSLEVVLGNQAVDQNSIMP